MVEFRYRGREISQEDILYIRALIERHPSESRTNFPSSIRYFSSLMYMFLNSSGFPWCCNSIGPFMGTGPV